MISGRGGILGYLPLRDSFRVEGSLMAGTYARGNGNNLGFPIEFRSRLGLSRAVSARWRIGAAFEHKSDASVGSHNPGVETAFVTLSYSYRAQHTRQ